MKVIYILICHPHCSHYFVFGGYDIYTKWSMNNFNHGVLMSRCLHESAPAYLTDEATTKFDLVWLILRPCQHDNGYIGHVPIIGGRFGRYRLDYGNSVFQIHLVRRLQFVQNAAAWFICRLWRFDHVTDALVSLYWLRILERVVYKIAVQTLKVLHGFVSEYLRLTIRIADLTGQQSLCSAGTNPASWNHRLNFHLLALELSRWPVLAYGIVCWQTLQRYRCCWPSAND